MAIAIHKIAERGRYLMRMAAHAGKEVMPETISAFRGNTDASLSRVVSELRKARGLNIPLAEPGTAIGAAKSLAERPLSLWQKLLGPSKLKLMPDTITPEENTWFQRKFSSVKEAGFISRLQDYGLTQKEATAFLAGFEKRAFGWGDAGNIAWELSGIPSVGRGLGNFGDAAQMATHGDLWGATKRFGSGLGHMALGVGGWIPGIGWAGKGLQAASMGLKGVRGMGLAAKALNVAGRGANAWKGFNLVGRTGALSKGVGRMAGRMGPEFAGLARGAENFGQRMSGLSNAWHAPAPYGPQLPGSAGLKSMNPFSKATWADRASAFRTPAANRTAAQSAYINHAKYSWPLNTALLAAPMALGGGEGADMPGAGEDAETFMNRLRQKYPVGEGFRGGGAGAPGYYR